MIPWNRGKIRYDIRGEKHPQWKGGKSTLNIIIRSSAFNKEWRRKIFKRDNYKCVICKIGGKIDRLDQLPNSKLEIIDYKTGRRPTDKEIRENLQMTVYALAANDPGIYNKKPEDVILSFYFFGTQEKVSSTRTGEQLKEARKKLIEKAEEIETSDFVPKVGRWCDFCDFRLICEAWQ